MRLKSLVFAAALATVSTPALAGPFTALYVFGDSLSDVGNVSAIADAAVPGAGPVVPLPPYAPGRASNGFVAVDYLAQALGLAPLMPSLLGGTNYAHIGAATGPIAAAGGIDNIGFLQGLPLPPTGLLNHQVSTFRALPGMADASALYFLWGGGNDIFIGASVGPLEALAAASFAAVNIGEAIQQLYNEGARNFLVPNLFAFSPAADVFNQALAFELAQRSMLPGIRLTSVDVSSRLAQFAMDPTYGFTRGLVPCLTGNVLAPGANACPSDDEQDASILWDSSHPTTRVHQLLAEDFLEALPSRQVPEPTTLTLAGLGLAFVARRLRRAA